MTLEIAGGQIWRQKEFPCCKRYVVLAPMYPNCFVLLSDPREHGGMVCTEIVGLTSEEASCFLVVPDEYVKWSYTPEELQAHFKKYKYTCDGQLSEIEEMLGTLTGPDTEES